MKIFMTYSIYYFIFQFGGLAAFCEGISPTKPPHSGVTGHKQLLSFRAQNVTCCCTQQLNMILKISGGPIACLPPRVAGQPTINGMACKLQKLVPVQKLYRVYARLVTRVATPFKFFSPLEKCVGHSQDIVLKTLGYSQKILRPPWRPKLVTGLVCACEKHT